MVSSDVMLDYHAMAFGDRRFEPLEDILENWSTIFSAEVALLVERGRNGAAKMLASKGMQATYVSAYIERWADADPWVPANSVIEGVWPTDDLCPRDELLKTEFYKLWLAPQRLEQGIRAVVALDDGRSWTITLLQSAQRTAPKRSLVQTLELGIPLLKATARMFSNAQDKSSERDAAIDVLDRLTTGIVLVDGRGRPVAMNKSAYEIIARTDALSVGRHGIYAAKPADNRRLQQLIERLSTPSSGKATDHGAVPISRSASAVPLAVIGSRLKTAESASGPAEPVLALFLSDPDEAQVEACEERLISLYALTRLEARLAVRLAQGLNLESIADELHLSIHTVRAYLKQIFAKTSVHRQSALVRLLMHGSATVRAGIIAAFAWGLTTFDAPISLINSTI